MLLFVSLLTGCSVIDKGKVKLGLKNEDFEYIKNNQVDKIVIQSTRDTGFRFVVTDKQTIEDMYGLLSSAKRTESKVALEPDYIFEVSIGEEVKKFNYVVGVAEKSKGNFYDDDKSYSVSSRIDNDIIQNLSFVRKPREFENIYYKSITNVLQKEKDRLVDGDNNIGIDIFGDVECTKYMLSRDIQEFKKEATKAINNISIIKGNKQDFDVVITVRNQGYTAKTFKTNVTIENKKNHSSITYYVVGNYDTKSWVIKSDTSKPKGW